LVIQLSFDILVYLHVLHLVVLTILFVQAVVHLSLEYSEIVYMLSHVIHCSLEALDVGVVPSDGHPILDDVFSHVRLLVTELVHDETKVSVDLVVPS